MYEASRTVLEQTVDDCIGCGNCAAAVCHGRTYTGTVGEAAQEVLDACDAGQAPSYDIERLVWGCSLCGGCTADCPVDISAPDVYAAARDCLSGGHVEETEAYSYLRTDYTHHTFALLREVDGIEYDDYLTRETAGAADGGCSGEKAATSLFFPGCSFATYAPGLCHKVDSWLREQGETCGMTALCCSRPVESMGALDTRDVYLEGFFARLEEKGISRLIVACPNCFYTLSGAVRRQGRDVSIALLPDVLREHGMSVPEETLAQLGTVTFHDSCPDRFDGSIHTAVRGLFGETSLLPMEHEGLHTICCGSGGLVGNYDPSICDIRAAARMDEAKATGADCLVCACINCASTFVQQDTGLPVRHYLEFLFDEAVDWTGAGHSSQRLMAKLSGEQIAAYFADKTAVFPKDDEQ